MNNNFPSNRPSRSVRFIGAFILAVQLITTGSPAQTAANDSTVIQIPVQAGWNLLSLPVSPVDCHKDTLFPASVSDALRFRNGYQAVDSIGNGYGFWLKFPSAGTIAVTGQGRFIDTLELRKGWNLVGVHSTPVAIGKITTSPPGLVAYSQFFRYVPGAGYTYADTLRPGQGYWVKSEGAGSMFMTSMDVPCPGITAIEYGGRTYTAVQIGNQCWMQQNLDVGEWIYGFEEQADNGTIEKYCFNDDPVTCRWYGAFYQWGEAMQYSTTGDRRGICPEGWHIPSQVDYESLASTVNGNGNALKRAWQGWGEGVGTNESGFSALLTGYRQRDGYFSMAGYSTYEWTSSEFNGGVARSMYLFGSIDLIYFNANYKEYGFSVRCLRD